MTSYYYCYSLLLTTTYQRLVAAHGSAVHLDVTLPQWHTLLSARTRVPLALADGGQPTTSLGREAGRVAGGGALDLVRVKG